jgi:hypothetical protein
MQRAQPVAIFAHGAIVQLAETVHGEDKEGAHGIGAAAWVGG